MRRSFKNDNLKIVEIIIFARGKFYDLNDAIAKLEIESHQVLEKIEVLKAKKSDFKDVNEYWEQLESLRKEKTTLIIE